MKKHGPLKIDRRAVQLYYDVHSWLGIVCGMVFFICVFSGSLALFKDEMTPWEVPAVRTAVDAPRLSVDELLEIAQARLGDDRDMLVTLPRPGVAAQARAFGEGGIDQVFIDPIDGGVIEAEGRTAFQFLTRLHTDLHLPRPVGRYLVGLLGILMMLSLISGLMAHPKVLKELFLLRRRPSLRLTFSDLHKQLGVWGLAFGLVMAFTGAVIGLLGLFAPVMVLSSFGGDVDQATEAFQGPHHEPTGIHRPMLSLEPLIEQVETAHPGHRVGSLAVSHWGDETADVGLHLVATPYRRLVAGETHRFSLVNGEPVHVSSFTDRGVGSRLFGAMHPVHYAMFGGLGLKLMYLLSGLALSFTIASGSVIWLEARRPKRSLPEGQPSARAEPIPYFKLGRLNLGVCLGLVVASAAAVGCGRLAAQWVEPVFWSLWLTIIIGSFFVPSGPWAIRRGAIVVALCLALGAVVDLGAPVDSEPGLPGVNLVILAFALASAAVGRMALSRKPLESSS